MPDPGRLQELLYPGVKVLLADRRKEYRKTRYDLVAVYHGDQWISLDSRIPNKLIFEALENKFLDEFLEYSTITPEFKFHESRIDFLLENGNKNCLIEVKSCTTVIDGVAFFSQCSHSSGQEAFNRTYESSERGCRSCILFVVQRTDASVLRPYDLIDHKFGETLREASSQGVEVYAYFSEFVGKE